MFQFIPVGTLIHILSQPHNSKSDTRLDTRSPTCSIEVIHGTESDHNISIIQPPVMMDPVLLQGPHVQHGELHQPHAGNSVQDYLITPEVLLKHQPQVLLKGQRWVPISLLICPLLNTIERHQGMVLVLKNQLSVVYHIVDHHSPKITIRKIGGLLCSGRVH